MSQFEKIDALLTELKNNNYSLMNQVSEMKGDLKKYYAKKVSELIDAQHQTVSGLNKKSLAGN